MLDPDEGIVVDPEAPFGAVGGADADAVGVRRDDVGEQDARVGGRLDQRVDRHAAADRCVGHARGRGAGVQDQHVARSTEEGRVGKEWGRKGRSGWGTEYYTKKTTTTK